MRPPPKSTGSGSLGLAPCNGRKELQNCQLDEFEKILFAELINGAQIKSVDNDYSGERKTACQNKLVDLNQPKSSGTQSKCDDQKKHIENKNALWSPECLLCYFLWREYLFDGRPAGNLIAQFGYLVDDLRYFVLDREGISARVLDITRGLRRAKFCLQNGNRVWMSSLRSRSCLWSRESNGAMR
jgi:hypothetical protein